MSTLCRWTLNAKQCVKWKSNNSISFHTHHYGEIYFTSDQFRKWSRLIRRIRHAPHRRVKKHFGHGILFLYSPPLIRIQRYNRSYDFTRDDWTFYITDVHDDLRRCYRERRKQCPRSPRPGEERDNSLLC